MFARVRLCSLELRPNCQLSPGLRTTMNLNLYKSNCLCCRHCSVTCLDYIALWKATFSAWHGLQEATTLLPIKSTKFSRTPSHYTFPVTARYCQHLVIDEKVRNKTRKTITCANQVPETIVGKDKRRTDETLARENGSCTTDLAGLLWLF